MLVFLFFLKFTNILGWFTAIRLFFTQRTIVDLRQWSHTNGTLVMISYSEFIMLLWLKEVMYKFWVTLVILSTVLMLQDPIW
jgi:hypothetical protein